MPTAPMLEALVQELRPHLISRRRRCDAASIFKVILKSGLACPRLGGLLRPTRRLQAARRAAAPGRAVLGFLDRSAR